MIKSVPDLAKRIMAYICLYNRRAQPFRLRTGTPELVCYLFNLLGTSLPKVMKDRLGLVAKLSTGAAPTGPSQQNTTKLLIARNGAIIGNRCYSTL